MSVCLCVCLFGCLSVFDTLVQKSKHPELIDSKKIGGVDFDFNKTRNVPAQARVMMKSVLSSAEHGRCPHKY